MGYCKSLKIRLVIAGMCMMCSFAADAQLHDMGRAYYRGKEYDKAIEYFKRAVEKDERTVESTFWIGYSFQAAENHNEAIRYFTEALKLDSIHESALYYRSLSYQKTGQFELEANDLSDCVRLVPSNSFYVKELAWAYAQQGNYSRALKHYDTLVLMEPKFGGGYARRADMLRLLGDDEKALEDYKRAIERDSTLYIAHAYIAQYTDDPSDPKAVEIAMHHANTAVRLQPDESLPYHIRSTILFSQGEYLRAFTDMDKCISIDSTNALYYSNRAHFRIMMGQDEWALPDLDKAIELNPNDIYHLRERTATYGRLKRYGEAIQDLHRILDVDRMNVYALSTLGDVHRSLGENKDAESWYKSVLQVDSVHKNAMLGLGLIYDQANDHDRAIHYYNQLLSVDSMDAFVWFKRHRIHSVSSKWDMALSDINFAISIDSTVSMLRLNRGIVLAQMGDTVGALNEMDRIIRLAPDYVPAYLHRGVLKMFRNGVEAGRFDFADALLHSRNDPRTHYMIGAGKLEYGAFSEAVEDFNKSVELAPQVQDPYLGLAKCYLALNDKKAACKNFRQAVKLGLKEDEGSRKKYCD